MSSVKLGGERLGSGKKNKYITKSFERSTHDLSYVWRSSMSSGTLVPFMNEVCLPGDTFDIKLDCDVKTLPTIGPLFGSYKVQLDVFEVPARLFNGILHMNKLNLGREMNKVLLPQIEVKHNFKASDIFNSNSQINPSSILSYLNIRGLGTKIDESTGAVVNGEIKRDFNAVPYLGYWSIFKNYYANKQEVNAKVIHASNQTTDILVQAFEDTSGNNWSSAATGRTIESTTRINAYVAYANDFIGELDPTTNLINEEVTGGFTRVWSDVFKEFKWKMTEKGYVLQMSRPYTEMVGKKMFFLNTIPKWKNTIANRLERATIKDFPLTNIDEEILDILSDVRGTTAYMIDENSRAPFGLPLTAVAPEGRGQYFTQEGLALKTYQSDKFNNWLNLEWIEGTNGVNEVTRVDTTGDSFTIDALSMANKVYKMLNRINMSGGTYNDWIDAVYSHDTVRKTESPIYHGSLIKELSFEEVVSTAEFEGSDLAQPLGTLAGKGRLTSKNKGGNIVIKTHEPGYVIGIVSLTPRVDYSQGNKWDVNLKTFDDFHKPDLDQIGFQDLVTDEMSWNDTYIGDVTGDIEYGTAGKVPAWLNYMTNVNMTRGNFADENKDMFMTLNRKYEGQIQGSNTGIADRTTYIDPSKYNHIFADTSLDSQNFWTQISVKNTARRKMSAKVIPNL